LSLTTSIALTLSTAVELDRDLFVDIFGKVEDVLFLRFLQLGRIAMGRTATCTSTSSAMDGIASSACCTPCTSSEVTSLRHGVRGSLFTVAMEMTDWHSWL
jgi:hypothetical protein